MNRRFALCVGNNYPDSDFSLDGCQNDAADWAKLLEKNDYEVAIVLEASHDGVLNAIRRMVREAGFGDRIVFTFSGHGTWVLDDKRQRQEAMVMRDLNLLLEDDLQEAFSELRWGADALILSDACHVGTAEPVVGRRFLSPIERGENFSLEEAIELEEYAARQPSRYASIYSATTDQKQATESVFNGRSSGVFTRVAVDMHLKGLSMTHWQEAIQTCLPNVNYPQRPQLTAPWFRKHVCAL